MGKASMAFLNAYTTTWDVNSWTRWCLVDNDSTWMHAQFHLRYIGGQSQGRIRTPGKAPPVHTILDRQNYEVVVEQCADGTISKTCVGEKRISISSSLTNGVFGYASFVVLADSWRFLESLEFGEDEAKRSRLPISQCPLMPRQSLFQLLVSRACDFGFSQTEKHLKTTRKVSNTSFSAS